MPAAPIGPGGIGGGTKPSGSSIPSGSISTPIKPSLTNPISISWPALKATSPAIPIAWLWAFPIIWCIWFGGGIILTNSPSPSRSTITSLAIIPAWSRAILLAISWAIPLAISIDIPPAIPLAMSWVKSIAMPIAICPAICSAISFDMPLAISIAIVSAIDCEFSIITPTSTSWNASAGKICAKFWFNSGIWKAGPPPGNGGKGCIPGRILGTTILFICSGLKFSNALGSTALSISTFISPKTSGESSSKCSGSKCWMTCGGRAPIISGFKPAIALCGIALICPSPIWASALGGTFPNFSASIFAISSGGISTYFLTVLTSYSTNASFITSLSSSFPIPVISPIGTLIIPSSCIIKRLLLKTPTWSPPSA